LEQNADIVGWEGEEREIETTELLGKKLAILGFDSCVMGMLEVGYQFERVAETMIVSEGSVPSAGWTYAKLLGCLTREDARQLSPQAVAERFVKEFVRSQDAYTVGGVSVDMAAWDMSSFIDLSAGFDGLATALLMCFEDKKSRIYRQMERVILKVHWQCQSYMYDQNVDLGDFCELLNRECEWVAKELGEGDGIDIVRLVQEQCRVVNEQLKLAVILSGFSGGTYQYSNGVSIFFPWSREGYEVSRKNYESLWYSADLERNEAPWTRFLTKYLNEVSLRKLEDMVEEEPPGRYRYLSGVKYREDTRSAASGRGSRRTKIAGHEGTKIAGHEGTKIAGHEGTKIAGHEGTKIAGHDGTKIAGHEGTKIAGHEGTKLAGGSSSSFFDSLKLFKNVESRWDVSGFTKKTD
jgi:Clostripain family